MSFWKSIYVRPLLMAMLGFMASGLISCISGVIGGFALCFFIVARQWQMFDFGRHAEVWVGFGQNVPEAFHLGIVAGIFGAMVGSIFGLATELSRLLKRQYFVWLTCAAMAGVGALVGCMAAVNIKMHVVQVNAGNEATWWFTVSILICGATGAAGGWLLGKFLVRFR